MRKITYILLLCVSSLATAQSSTDSLLLHYEFDGNTIDQINSYDGTPTNIVYGPDRNLNPSSAAYFNGVNSYIDFPNLSELKPALPVSFSFWIKYDSNQFEQQVVFNTSYEENHATSVVFNTTAGTNQYAINYADGQYTYGPTSRRSYVSNLSVDTSEWKHVSIVVNSATDMKIYIDCVEAGGTYSGTGGTLQYSIFPGCLGRHDRNVEDAPGYFKGYIDDFKYWQRALSVEEIAVLCSPLATESFVVNKSVIFPNPVEGMLQITSATAEKIMIYDLSGRKVYNEQFRPTIDLSSLPAGIYILQLEGNHVSETHKITVK